MLSYSTSVAWRLCSISFVHLCGASSHTRYTSILPVAVLLLATAFVPVKAVRAPVPGVVGVEGIEEVDKGIVDQCEYSRNETGMV